MKSSRVETMPMVCSRGLAARRYVAAPRVNPVVPRPPKRKSTAPMSAKISFPVVSWWVRRLRWLVYCEVW